MLEKKQNVFRNYAKPISLKKGFHCKQKFTLKTKRCVTSSERTIANIFSNYFGNIT